MDTRTGPITDRDMGELIAILANEPEIKCEAKHRAYGCTVEVRWQRPQKPCGCEPPAKVCQGTYDYFFNGTDIPFQCTICLTVYPASEARKGWRPI